MYPTVCPLLIQKEANPFTDGRMWGLGLRAIFSSTSSIMRLLMLRESVTLTTRTLPSTRVSCTCRGMREGRGESCGAVRVREAPCVRRASRLHLHPGERREEDLLLVRVLQREEVEVRWWRRW